MSYWTCGDGLTGGAGVVGGILSILFWIFVIVLIVAIVRRILWTSRGEDRMRHFMPPFDKTPLDILKERYAKGEIDKAEFEDKKKDIQM